MIKTKTLALALAASLLAPLPALAQSVNVLGDFRDWSAYTASEGAGMLCFVLSKPKEVVPQPDGYTDAFLYLTHRPGQSIRFELNIVAGYTFAADSQAEAIVGDRRFALYTRDDAAWLADPGQAENLAGAMRAGTQMVIEGTTDRGIKVAQTFSLSGATAASNAINSACA